MVIFICCGNVIVWCIGIIFIDGIIGSGIGCVICIVWWVVVVEGICICWGCICGIIIIISCVDFSIIGNCGFYVIVINFKINGDCFCIIKCGNWAGYGIGCLIIILCLVCVCKV